MQKARCHHTKWLQQVVGVRFQVLFHSPVRGSFHLLFTFPSQYWFTIGLLGVFSLTGWSPQIQTGFLVSRLTQDTADPQHDYPYQTITVYGPTFQLCSGSLLLQCRSPTTPHLP